jgi:hypothetical protein
MITRIVHTDDELGDFVYERDPQGPFKWHLVSIGATILGDFDFAVHVQHDGRDVLWQTAIAVQQGVET